MTRAGGSDVPNAEGGREGVFSQDGMESLWRNMPHTEQKGFDRSPTAHPWLVTSPVGARTSARRGPCLRVAVSRDTDGPPLRGRGVALTRESGRGQEERRPPEPPLERARAGKRVNDADTAGRTPP
ncbi:hypothetical protein GCM10028832_00590 [Streptomyces sparsus]